MSLTADIVLGIDPGTQVAGIGVISQSQGKVSYVASTHIRFRKDEALALKLAHFFQEISVWIELYRPQAMAIESIFHHKNVKSAITLAHARGTAMLTAAHFKVPVYEYSPLEVKMAATGYGRAGKDQVALMLGKLFPPLRLKEEVCEDETDAVAVAYCHMGSQKIKNIAGLTENAPKGKSRTWDDWLAARNRSK